MLEYICNIGGGYSWGKLYYDTDTRVFHCKNYHCGMVDIAEDFFDGESVLSKQEVFSVLIKEGKLNSLSELYDSTTDSAMLCEILNTMKCVSNLQTTVFQGDSRCVYYLFPDGRYVIFFYGTYFSVGKKGEPVVDFNAVKDILDNCSVVKASRYLKK